MPKQLELPFPKDDSDDFDSVYLDARVALNALEQLNFQAERIVLKLYLDRGYQTVHVEVGWPNEPASEHDRDIFAELVEDGGHLIIRTGADASITLGKMVLTLHNAFPNPEAIVGRPTIEDLYPSSKFGERGPRGRLNPLMETALGHFRPKDQ
jgi:hypothetical protein